MDHPYCITDPQNLQFKKAKLQTRLAAGIPAGTA